MGYCTGEVLDPLHPPSVALEAAANGASASGSLKIQSRDQERIVIVRKRARTFAFGLLLSVILPGPGWLVGWWLVTRNARWKLIVETRPWAPGSKASWTLRSPMRQAELDAHLIGRGTVERFEIAVNLIRAG
jgi:hypothetical protein